jgi:hypothetical protein
VLYEPGVFSILGIALVYNLLKRHYFEEKHQHFFLIFETAVKFHLMFFVVWSIVKVAHSMARLYFSGLWTPGQLLIKSLSGWGNQVRKA